MEGPSGIVEEQDKPFLRLRSESGVENVYYSAWNEELPEEFRLQAEKELNETSEKRKEGLQKLKEVIKKDKLDSMCDNILLSVLRSNKYDIKKSKAKLRKFAAIHRKVIDQLADVDLAKMEKIVEDMPIGILPYRDKHGRVIVYTRPYGVNLEVYDFEDIALCSLAVVMFLLAYPITTVAGIVYFGDCKSPSFSLLYQFSKMIRYHSWTFVSYPIRVKRVEALNEMALIRWVYFASAPFLPQKIIKRFSFHGAGYDHLHKEYDRRILPDAFGGDLGPLSSELYKKRVVDYISDLKDEGQRNSFKRK